MKCICDIFDIGYRCPACVVACGEKGHAECWCHLAEKRRNEPLDSLFSADELVRSRVSSTTTPVTPVADMGAGEQQEES